MSISKFSVIWAATGSTTKPNDSKISAGWSISPPEQPPAVWFNWILNAEQTKINALIDASNVYETELSNVITAAGIVPDLVPGGPGDQLMEAIFASNALGDDAFGAGISWDHFGPLGDIALETTGGGDTESTNVQAGYADFNLSNASRINTISINANGPGDIPVITVAGQTPLTTGPLKTATLKNDGLQIASTGSATVFAASASVISVSNADTGLTASMSLAGGLFIYDGRTATDPTTAISTRITTQGIRFEGAGSPGESTQDHRFYVVTLNAEAFDFYDLATGGETAGGTAHTHTMGFFFQRSGSALFASTIPSDCPLLGASLRYKQAGGTFAVVPVTLRGLEAGPVESPVWYIDRFDVPGADYAINVDTTADPVLTIHYDASGL